MSSWEVSTVLITETCGGGGEHSLKFKVKNKQRAHQRTEPARLPHRPGAALPPRRAATEPPLRRSRACSTLCRAQARCGLPGPGGRTRLRSGRAPVLRRAAPATSPSRYGGRRGESQGGPEPLQRPLRAPHRTYHGGGDGGPRGTPGGERPGLAPAALLRRGTAVRHPNGPAVPPACAPTFRPRSGGAALAPLPAPPRPAAGRRGPSRPPPWVPARRLGGAPGRRRAEGSGRRRRWRRDPGPRARRHLPAQPRHRRHGQRLLPHLQPAGEDDLHRQGLQVRGPPTPAWHGTYGRPPPGDGASGPWGDCMGGGLPAAGGVPSPSTGSPCTGGVPPHSGESFPLGGPFPRGPPALGGPSASGAGILPSALLAGKIRLQDVSISEELISFIYNLSNQLSSSGWGGSVEKPATFPSLARIAT